MVQENYIIVPETSFTEEPCVIFDRQETNGRVPSWIAELHYSSEVKGLTKITCENFFVDTVLPFKNNILNI